MKYLTKKLILQISLGILSIFFLLLYFKYPFWSHFKTKNFKALVEYNGSNIHGLLGRQILIHKDFKQYIEQIDKYAADNDIELIVIQSYRNENQKISRNIVKPAKLSNHLAGFAIDFNIKRNNKIYLSNHLKKRNLSKSHVNVQNFINDIRENKNLRWGGDFQIEDPVHIDVPLNQMNKAKWFDFNKNCATDYANRIPKWKFWK